MNLKCEPKEAKPCPLGSLRSKPQKQAMRIRLRTRRPHGLQWRALKIRGNTRRSASADNFRSIFDDKNETRFDKQVYQQQYLVNRSPMVCGSRKNSSISRSYDQDKLLRWRGTCRLQGVFSLTQSDNTPDDLSSSVTSIAPERGNELQICKF